jgi:hypothetical protein
MTAVMMEITSTSIEGVMLRRVLGQTHRHVQMKRTPGSRVAKGVAYFLQAVMDRQRRI